MKTSIIALALVLNACGYNNPSAGTVKNVWYSTSYEVDFGDNNFPSGTARVTNLTYSTCSCNSVLTGNTTSGTYTFSNCGYVTTAGGGPSISCSNLNGTGSYSLANGTLALTGTVAGNYK